MLRLLALVSLTTTSVPTFTKDVKPIFDKRCSQCHNENWAEKNWLNYDTAVKNKDKIKDRVINKKDMPPANITEMLDAERNIIKDWLEKGTKK